MIITTGCFSIQAFGEVFPRRGNGRKGEGAKRDIRLRTLDSLGWPSETTKNWRGRELRQRGFIPAPKTTNQKEGNTPHESPGPETHTAYEAIYNYNNREALKVS